MKKTIIGTGVVAALAAATLLTGCQCAPPVGECVETRTEVDVANKACVPAKVASCPTGATTSTVTVIHRTENACGTLPPVREITVVRCPPGRTKMVFVYVKPICYGYDRCYNVESRNFERPWPWGPYGMGNCDY